MRALRRPTRTPPSLNHTKVTAHADRLADAQAKGEEDITFRANYWNEADVRGALRAMQGFACAYCGSKVGTTDEGSREDEGDVDHFRPKALYPWLAYTFSNHLLSCGVCNSRRKRDEFPTTCGPRVHAPRRERVAAERHLWIDPSRDPVDELLTWEFPTRVLRGGLLTVVEPRLAPTAGLDPWSELRARVTLDTFQGDDPELRQRRVRACAAAAERPAEWAATAFHEHGAAVRAFLRHRSLPVPDDARSYALLVDRLDERLSLWWPIFSGSDGHRLYSQARMHCERALWALAFLARAMDDVARGAVEALLARTPRPEYADALNDRMSTLSAP